VDIEPTGERGSQIAHFNERPSVVISLSFRVFRVFRGFNCCFQVQRFVLEKAVQPRISRITRIKKGLRWTPFSCPPHVSDSLFPVQPYPCYPCNPWFIPNSAVELTAKSTKIAKKDSYEWIA